MMTISRWRVYIGAAALIACIQYLLAEALAAAAWRNPPYSYARNYISDLGIPGCGAVIGSSPVCSPLAVVMNCGFVFSGLLCLVATLTLAPVLPRPTWRWPLIGLAVVHGLGSILVGLVHSAPGTVAGSPHFHIVGAYMAILCGNLALTAAGLATRRPHGFGRFAAFSLAMGTLGLVGAVALVKSQLFPPGVSERIAVDTITVWEVCTGVILAVALRRARRTGDAITSDALRRAFVGI